MLRLIFVLSLLTGLGVVALRGPMKAIVLYLWLAYFRPEAWIYGGLLASLPLSYVAGIYLVLRVGFSATMFRFDLRVLALLLVWATAIVGGLLTPWPDETNYILTAIT